jgi:hypothetical protein
LCAQSDAEGLWSSDDDDDFNPKSVDVSLIDAIETIETGQNDSLSFKAWPQAWLLSEEEDEDTNEAASEEGKGCDLLWQAAAITEEEKLLRSRKHTEELVKVPPSRTDRTSYLLTIFVQLYEVQFHRLHQELRRKFFDFMGNEQGNSNRPGKQAGKHRLRKRRKRSVSRGGAALSSSRSSKYLQGQMHSQRAVAGIQPPGELRKNTNAILTGLWSSKRQVMIVLTPL